MIRPRLGAVIVALTCIATVAKADAEPLVTISCDQPNGFNMEYGVPLMDRLDAAANNRPEPTKSTLRGPTKDGYVAKPTFVIDSNRKNVTIIWAELPEDVEIRKQAKELKLPQMPPPPATDATIVLFLKNQISAIQVAPWSIMTYSFFPTKGTAFISQQFMAIGSNSIRQMATFTHCEFSWTDPQ